MEKVVLDATHAGDWTYRGEGAANLVLAYSGSSPRFVCFLFTFCLYFLHFIAFTLYILLTNLIVFSTVNIDHLLYLLLLTYSAHISISSKRGLYVLFFCLLLIMLSIGWESTTCA